MRVVVVLRYYARMNATEVGAAMGIPPATVRTRLKRALGILRERMEPCIEPSGQRPVNGREGAHG
jgi:DNA-directed RNA polymerase specialized sigma24 family protein